MKTSEVVIEMIKNDKKQAKLLPSISEKDKTNLENAAPDLLRALEGLYNHTKNNHQIFGLNVAAKEAIDKAKGVK